MTLIYRRIPLGDMTASRIFRSILIGIQEQATFTAEISETTGYSQTAAPSSILLAQQPDRARSSPKLLKALTAFSTPKTL